MGLWTEAAWAFQARAEPCQRSPLGWAGSVGVCGGPPGLPSLPILGVPPCCSWSAVPCHKSQPPLQKLHVCWQSLPQKREEKTTLSGVDSMRSQALYWAAHQNLCHTDAALHCTITQAAAHSEGKPSTSQRTASQNHRAATTPWEREQIQVLEQWQC